METKRSKIILFCAAGVLLIIALVWNIRLNTTSEGSRLCRTLNEYGYTLHPGRSVSIRRVERYEHTHASARYRAQ